MSPEPLIKSPEVTVLMSCFNASRWLRIAIDSVLHQTFGNFEFILVDDGSTDGTWDIIQAYREMDHRIVAIKKENTGLLHSLNVGIAHARGGWIARLDADDLCEPDRLAEQLRFVRDHPEVVLLGTDFVEIDEQGRVVKNHKCPSEHHVLLRHLERLQLIFPHSSAFFRRETARELGFYNPLFRKSQDWDLWLRFSERGRIGCLKNSLVRFRRHSEQISDSAVGTPQHVYGTAAAVCHFLRTYNCQDPSANSGQVAWKGFLAWIEKRMIQENVFEKRKVWIDARAKYFAAENRLAGSFHFGTHILKSDYPVAIAWGKIFGSSLPERLAQEWMKRSCAAS